MPIPFSSADEFLNYTKFLRSNSIIQIASEPNLEFKRIVEARCQGFEIPPDPYDHIVRELWQELKKELSSHFLETIGDKLAVGALDNISVNAFCTRSADGFFAIVINSGLLLFLNKVSKLHVAISIPNSIIYCNRLAPDKITQSMVKNWLFEVCEHYRATGKPLGPQIHLSDSASLRHSYQLHMWELFILAHELGHFVAGHSEEAGNWILDPVFNMVETYQGNTSHQKEFEADLHGYRMLRGSMYRRLHNPLMKDNKLWDDRPLFLNIISLFNLLSMLGSRESHTHPDPLDRICNIALIFYGELFAKLLASSYEDGDLLGELFAKPLIPQASCEF